MEKHQILVSGSLAYDKIMNFPGYFRDSFIADKIHNINVSFLVENHQESFGGTAGNIAYNLALLEENPIILAQAGKDFEPYQKWLAKHKVDLSQVEINPSEPTAFANIMTDKGDNQIAAFYPGAMNQKINFKKSRFKGKNTLAIISPGNSDDMLNLAKIYQSQNINYVFDPGQQIPALSSRALRESIKGAKVFISNDYELSLILEKTRLSEKEILASVEILVTTLGELGSVIKTKDKIHKIPPAKPENTSDPTGAGDAYRAGFIKGLALGWPLPQTGRFAGVAACYTVEKYGTQTHQFSISEIKRRYKKNFKEDLIF